MIQQSIKHIRRNSKRFMCVTLVFALSGCKTMPANPASKVATDFDKTTQTNLSEDNYIIRPQEIYLLERYSSPEYFKAMRDAFSNMLEAGEQALDIFMHDLPYDLRGRPLNRQYDIVWGERVLPNLRDVLDSLNIGYQELLSGDYTALGYGGNIKSAFRAINTDYDFEWMPKQQLAEYDKWEREAGVRAFNLEISSYYGWNVGDLTERYSIESRGPLDAPESWPIYRLNPDMTFKTDEVVKVGGVYVPNRADASAQILPASYKAPEAYVGYDPETMQAVGVAPVTWMLVERVADNPVNTHDVRAKYIEALVKDYDEIFNAELASNLADIPKSEHNGGTDSYLGDLKILNNELVLEVSGGELLIVTKNERQEQLKQQLIQFVSDNNDVPIRVNIQGYIEDKYNDDDLYKLVLVNYSGLEANATHSFIKMLEMISAEEE